MTPGPRRTAGAGPPPTAWTGRSSSEVREAVAPYMAAGLLNAGAAVAAGYVAVRLTAMRRSRAVRGPLAG